MHPRLYLITPPQFDCDAFAPMLEEALEGGDVACVLISMPDATEADLQRTAKKLVPIIQAADAAALVENNTQIMGRSGADGLHFVGSDAALEEVMRDFQEEKIIGHSGVKTRHEAMTIASMGVDYVFFGLLDLEQTPEAHPKTLDFGSWWAEVFETPCVVLGGTSLDSVKPCAETHAEFVALREAIWTHPEGPKAAVQQANAILEQVTLPDSEE
ncbi:MULTISPECIES: thiamine phosphate synthase [Pseudovibrio]|uniref:thiamine phosphate synthase n=1 Tax=Stappiaceae TaxID=2821832 RepID=UPI002366E7EA|nr:MULTISPECIES: thiamine phosphate synthase [Pseudovibrio]MDD7911901.1 thiamine phosphate synthase [Pseudovibrio exalbescens]MDX5595433.1 thiamine phosphate synthase [Pseudovibrio sp. SPO723]